METYNASPFGLRYYVTTEWVTKKKTKKRSPGAKKKAVVKTSAPRQRSHSKSSKNIKKRLRGGERVGNEAILSDLKARQQRHAEVLRQKRRERQRKLRAVTSSSSKRKNLALVRKYSGNRSWDQKSKSSSSRKPKKRRVIQDSE